MIHINMGNTMTESEHRETIEQQQARQFANRINTVADRLAKMAEDVRSFAAGATNLRQRGGTRTYAAIAADVQGLVMGGLPYLSLGELTAAAYEADRARLVGDRDSGDNGAVLDRESGCPEHSWCRICPTCGHGHGKDIDCPGHSWQDSCPYYGFACVALSSPVAVPAEPGEHNHGYGVDDETR